jgi:multiple sugar transport system substrate-binding protein
MKYIFLAAFLLLGAVSLASHMMSPEVGGTAPVLYWVTDNNPARAEQVRLFHEWLAKNGHPDVDLRLDTSNGDISKKIIQGVSGVGGDIMDTGPTDMPYFVAVGIMADVTEAAQKLGFGPSNTYPAIKPQIVFEDKQYRFPCNVFATMYWVNLDTFKKLGLPPPPKRWDFDTFERQGEAFVAAANKGKSRQTAFFCSGVDAGIMRRSLGLDTFNETLTRCTLDDPRYVQVMHRIHKWTYEDHILPRAQDIASFATSAGYAGATLQLFNSGNYGMFAMGRYALIQLRQFGDLNLAVVEPPNGGFVNTLLGTRAASVYAGGKHKDLAELFLAFLASKEYNEQIVADADALPPNPIYTQTEAFRHPPKHHNEWACHEPFAEAAQTIAITETTSPFVLPSVVQRLNSNFYDAYMLSGRLTATQAARQVAEQINSEIERSLQEDPSMRPKFEQACAMQKKIDEYRAAGKKVPLAWIKNPFHRAYYQAQGWAE